MNKKNKKINDDMKKIGFSLICAIALFFSFQVVSAQDVFSPASPNNQFDDFVFDEYIFSETTPSDMTIKEISNGVLSDEGNNSPSGDDSGAWGPGPGGGPGGSGDQDGSGVGTPIGDGLLVLLLSGIVYGGIIFIKRK